jgi:hypothetical protein
MDITLRKHADALRFTPSDIPLNTKVSSLGYIPKDRHSGKKVLTTSSLRVSASEARILSTSRLDVVGTGEGLPEIRPTGDKERRML